MAWIQLVIAGLFEVVWATSLKYTEGFTKLFPSIITIAGMVISFYFLSSAIKTLPMGTAYAIWTGIGALGTGEMRIHEAIMEGLTPNTSYTTV
ncbi:multidrug efflux SMR transporter [Peribacillus frigoritolerans]|uniref:DMT family transporter n=1 Tax=Peribacillus frigoritolerans TaxID=450367 RepID=UPI002B24C23B|nr:multidrug efflux SMR transporter [Peribacillus frigoritolerans]MEB2627021.1 multidrug efflux SMR transporter [Peribacillus frigoritolerans]